MKVSEMISERSFSVLTAAYEKYMSVYFRGCGKREGRKGAEKSEEKENEGKRRRKGRIICLLLILHCLQGLP